MFFSNSFNAQNINRARQRNRQRQQRYREEYNQEENQNQRVIPRGNRLAVFIQLLPLLCLTIISIFPSIFQSVNKYL
jgi:hypothetical protein